MNSGFELVTENCQLYLSPSERGEVEGRICNSADSKLIMFRLDEDDCLMLSRALIDMVMELREFRLHRSKESDS